MKKNMHAKSNGPQGPQGPQAPLGQWHLEFIETKVNSNNLGLNLHLNPMDHRDHKDHRHHRDKGT